MTGSGCREVEVAADRRGGELIKRPVQAPGLKPTARQVDLAGAQVPDLAGQQRVYAASATTARNAGSRPAASAVAVSRCAGSGTGTDGLRLPTRIPQTGLAKIIRSAFKVPNRLRSVLASWGRDRSGRPASDVVTGDLPPRRRPRPLHQRLERQVDPSGKLPPDERDRRVRAAARPLSARLNLAKASKRQRKHRA